jgi:thiol-disulfide isomerase/thioredoxin
MKKRGLILALVLASGAVHSADLRDAEAVPQLGPYGVEGYREFLAAGRHRAFVIAPGGAWAWRADLTSKELAERAVLNDCQEQTQQTCVLYAVDDRVVFDAKAWPKLWGPYSTAEAAKQAPIGTRRGERFPDLSFRDATGQTHKVSDFRGKVLVLHFWGTWCGPCRRELPDLQRLVRQMEKARDVSFVFLPVREPFKAASEWAQAQRLHLPLYDSGVDGRGENAFLLADGSKLPDRKVAGKFPTTYVLDKHGMVIFAHVGDASRWPEYAPFLKDAAASSGK